MISENIEDRTYQTLNSIEEQFEVLNQKDNGYNEEKAEMEIKGFLKHLDDNQITYTENEKKELLEKFAGQIVYKVKKKHPEKIILYGNFMKNVSFSEKKKTVRMYFERLFNKSKWDIFWNCFENEKRILPIS